MPDVTTGNSATIAFATSGFTPTIVSIDGLEETLEALENSNLSTTNYKTMVPADLKDISPVTVAIRWDNGDIPPLGTVELMTTTFPLESGESVAATFTATGFLTARSGPNLANNEIASGSITIQYDGGATEPTYTAGS